MVNSYPTNVCVVNRRSKKLSSRESFSASVLSKNPSLVGMRALQLLMMLLLVACGGPKKSNDSGHVDHEANERVKTEAEANAKSEQYESQEIARLNALYNPWRLPRPALAQDGLGAWRQSDIAFVKPGYDSLKARMALLDYATRSVRVQTFILSGDETGQMFANKLIELASRGVQVQLIVDDTTTIFKGAQSLYFYLTSHGIRVNGYRPIWMQVGNNPGVFTRMFTGTTMVDRFGEAISVTKIENHRFHEKIMVVDAEIPGKAAAMIGGTNIANEYYDIIGEPTVLKWRDQDMVVRGDIVNDLTAAFDSNVGDINTVNGQMYFSDTIEQYVSGQRGSFGTNTAPGIEIRPYAMQQYKEALSRKLNLRWNTSNIRMIHHRPLHNEYKAEQRLVTAIMNAQKEAIIVNPYVIPSDGVMNAMITAARRGVNIKILTNSYESGDTQTVQDVGRMFYKTLILETQPSNRWPRSVPISIYEWGGDKVFKNGFSNFHAKYVLIDRQMALFGSYNLDPRSAVWNSEVLFESDAPLLVAQLYEQQQLDSGPGYATLVTKEMAETYKSGGSTWDNVRREVLYLFKVFL